MSPPISYGRGAQKQKQFSGVEYLSGSRFLR